MPTFSVSILTRNIILCFLTVPPKIIVAPEPKSGPVAMNARFSCEASGVSDPLIRWIHNGREVTETGRYTLQNNNDLIIATKPEDDGIVQCVAENEAGVQTANTKLTVRNCE